MVVMPQNVMFLYHFNNSRDKSDFANLQDSPQPQLHIYIKNIAGRICVRLNSIMDYANYELVIDLKLIQMLFISQPRRCPSATIQTT